MQRFINWTFTCHTLVRSADHHGNLLRFLSSLIYSWKPSMAMLEEMRRRRRRTQTGCFLLCAAQIKQHGRCCCGLHEAWYLQVKLITWAQEHFQIINKLWHHEFLNQRFDIDVLFSKLSNLLCKESKVSLLICLPMKQNPAHLLSISSNKMFKCHLFSFFFLWLY